MQNVLYRQKEQFSDGVGYSWIDGLKAHADQHVIRLNFLPIVLQAMFEMRSGIVRSKDS